MMDINMNKSNFDHLRFLNVFTESRIVGKTVYHASTEQFVALLQQPSWFAINRKEVDAWANVMKENAGEAFIYSAKLSTNIIGYNDELFKNMMNSHGFSINDYITKLSENPTPRQVLLMPETKMLMKSQYGAFINNDYDPNDWSKDSDTIVVFEPWKTITSFKLIKRL